MLLLLSLPIIINTQYILTLWLKEVPNHTALFVQSVLIFTMSESISTPLITAMLATGNIRNYQIVVGGLQIMNLPISYILLRWIHTRICYFCSNIYFPMLPSSKINHA